MTTDSIPPDESPGNDQAKRDRRKKDRFEQDRSRAVWLGNGTALLDGRIVRFLTDDIRILINGVAYIRKQTTIRDSLTAVTELEIEVRLETGRVLPAFTIPADDFPRIEQWMAKHCGGLAVLSPVRGDAGYLRSAIQNLSLQDGIEEVEVFTDLGWTRIDGIPHFRGAIGAVGPTCIREDIITRPAENLALVELELVLGPDQTRADARSVLKMMQVAPARIMAPLIAAPFVAILGAFVPVDFSIGLFGTTGAGKTELLSLAQGFFGRKFNGRVTMASAMSTANYNESLAFHAQHVVFGIDDIAPDGTKIDQQRRQAEMDRLLRSAGNQQGRGRLKADGSISPQKNPRGLVMWAGEANDAGHSAGGRMIALQIAKAEPNGRAGDVRFDVLTDLQIARDNGDLVRNATAFMRYVAKNWDAVGESYRSRREGHLAHLRTLPAAHSRHPSTLATLFAAMDVWCDAMVQLGGLTEEEAQRVSRYVGAGLDSAADEQHEALDRSDPLVQFLSTVRAAISAGRAHIANLDNEAPTRATALGWRREAVPGGYGVSVPGFRAMGDRIGWIDDRGVFLIPESSLGVVQSFGRDQGISIPWSHRTLGKRLAEAGHILSSESNLNTQKISVASSRVRAWHIATSHLLDLEPSEQSAFITDFPAREGAA